VRDVLLFLYRAPLRGQPSPPEVWRRSFLRRFLPQPNPGPGAALRPASPSSCSLECYHRGVTRDGVRFASLCAGTLISNPVHASPFVADSCLGEVGVVDERSGNPWRV